jgi:hypothetical protein
MEMSWKAMKGMLDRDELLKRIGLEERSATGDFFTGLGLFSVGVLVGAGLGLMFAPRRGEEMRQTVKDAWRQRGAKTSGPDYQAMGAETAAVPPLSQGGH